MSPLGPHISHRALAVCVAKQMLQQSRDGVLRANTSKVKLIHAYGNSLVITYVEQGQEVAPVPHNRQNPQASNCLIYHIIQI